MSSWTSRVATGSSPEVGSSKNSTAGSLSRALASADPLAEALGEEPAEIVGPVGQVDRPERPLDALLAVGQPVETGEAFEVLGHREAEVEAGGLGHDRDPLPDGRAVLGASRGCPATVAEPEVGASSVPSVRTVVVLPGPVRAEEAEHLAVADLEGHVVEGGPAAEPLAQTIDD